MKNIEQAISDISQGRFVIVLEDKGGGGYLVVAADKVTPDAISYLTRSCTGITSICLSRDIMERYEIPEFPRSATFGASVDYLPQRRSGVSPTEKYRTIRALIGGEAVAADFKKPGHIYPVGYVGGGVLTHPRVQEAGVDLVRLSGAFPAAVLGQVRAEDGSVADIGAIQAFAKREQLTIITVSDLVSYRWHYETLVKEISRARLPTDFGEFQMILFGSVVDDIEHIALVKGEFAEGDEVLVRIHSECVTGEIFGSLRCDCGNQLRGAMSRITEEGKGAIIYMRGHEGRGIGLAGKLRAYCLQDEGYDTVEANIALGFPADKREYGVGAQMLRSLGVKKVKLLTNNPRKTSALQAYGIEIVDRVPLVCETNVESAKYLRTKKLKLGHMIDM